MSHVNDISTNEFSREVINAPVPVVVDFHAHWCPPCRALAPAFDQLAAAFNGRVKFVKVNVDDEPEVAASYRVASIPTLLVFDHGQIVSRHEGLPDLRAFVAQLDRLAGTAVAARVA